MGRQRARELRPVETHLAPKQLLQLSVLLDQTFDALAEPAALRIEVLLEAPRQLLCDASLVSIESLPELLQQPIAFVADILHVNARSRMTQGERTDFQGADREVVPCAPIGVGFELIAELRVGHVQRDFQPNMLLAACARSLERTVDGAVGLLHAIPMASPVPQSIRLRPEPQHFCDDQGRALPLPQNILWPSQEFLYVITMKMLAAWIGTADLNAPDLRDERDVGPIAQALMSRSFDSALLLADQAPDRVAAYRAWLQERTTARLEVEPVSLTSPTNFGEIYKAAISALDRRLATLIKAPSSHSTSARERRRWRLSGSSWARPGTGRAH